MNFYPAPTMDLFLGELELHDHKIRLMQLKTGHVLLTITERATGTGFALPLVPDDMQDFAVFMDEVLFEEPEGDTGMEDVD